MIQVVLVEPENAGNVGAICRVMKNFDVEKLILVNPQFDIKNNIDNSHSELRNRAKWAQDVVKDVKVVKTLNNIKADYKIATTAKLGRDYNVLRSPITPAQLNERLIEINNTVNKKTNKKNSKSKTKTSTKTSTSNRTIAIIFGREGSGLNNEEIASCDFTLTIPTSKKYGTMNLSHSVAIILYELFKKQNTENIISHITPISENEKKQILKILENGMDKLYFATEEKKETQRIVWKKMISKSFLSKREAYALMGFLKKIK